MAHLDKANALASSSSVDELRYAALELRLAIECLVYQFLPYYRDEVADEILEEWRPAVILDALVEANPDLPHSHVLRFGAESTSGEPTAWFTMGTQTGVNPKHLRAAHHRLSSFLHAPMEGSALDPEKLKRSIAKVVRLLEPYRTDGVINNFAVRHSVVCECGRKLSRRARAIEKQPVVRCPNKSCKRLYRYVSEEGGKSMWERVTQQVVCQKCKKVTYFSVAQIEPGARLQCSYCDAITRLESVVMARLEPGAG